MRSSLTATPIAQASAWMTGTLCAFTLMAIAGRELSADLNTFQILFFRSLISLGLISLWLTITGWHPIKTQQLGTHGLRNAAHFLGQYGWFYGIGLIPLAEVFAIEFTVPIWTAVIATLILNERLNKARVFAIITGLLGVLIILRPGLEIINTASLAVLGGAISYALAHTLTKKISHQDSPLGIIFYMALMQLPLGLVPCLMDWKTPTGSLWGWLTLIALCALVAHYCLARALSLADATVVIPMDFLRLPLIAVVGFLLYKEVIDWPIFAGASLIVLGNMINLMYERRLGFQQGS
ncbi:MAG: EamA family transporter [Gammaproteobacteria bacterium]|nr:MAG: EamA family transporter [Gammaproteobacteria bacterium]